MLGEISCVKGKKGFTLIELMIVVAIIGVLAAIAIPNFRNYQLKAKRSELPTNLKAVRTASVGYQVEHGRFLQLADQPRAATVATLNSSKSGWQSDPNWTAIGWQPTGDVYGAYGSVAAETGLVWIVGNATSNIDDDANLATYKFTVNIANPGWDNDVRGPAAGPGVF